MTLTETLEQSISLEESSHITQNMVDELAQSNAVISQAIQELERLQAENRRLSVQNFRYREQLAACHAELREYENSTGNDKFRNEDYH